MTSRLTQPGLPHRLALSATVAGCLLLILPVCLAAADPFYTGLLRKGSLALSRGDYATAVRELRIACFGLLEEPDSLADCLICLGLAQAGAGDSEGFEETFQRLSEAEELVGAYTTATIPPEIRAEFELEARRRMPADLLASVPAFASLAAPAPMTEAPVAGDSRATLKEVLAEDPENREALLGLARLAVADKRSEQAIALLDRLLELDPDDPVAHCLRGATWRQLKDCNLAVVDLRACDATTSDPELATTRLECLAKLKQWPEANAFFAQLPEEIRAQPKLARIGTKADRIVARQARADEPAVLAATDSKVVPAEPSAADLALLYQLRADLQDSKRVGELGRVHNGTRQIANDFPDWGEAQFLAAESAYRLSFWNESLTFFHRGGDPGDDQPGLLFYMAISLYESGDRESAASALERALPALERNAFVDSYVAKILGTGRERG